MLRLTLVGILLVSFFIPGDFSYYYYYSNQAEGQLDTAADDFDWLAPWAKNETGPCSNLRKPCSSISMMMIMIMTL